MTTTLFGLTRLRVSLSGGQVFVFDERWNGCFVSVFDFVELSWYIVGKTTQKLVLCLPRSSSIEGNIYIVATCNCMKGQAVLFLFRRSVKENNDGQKHPFQQCMDVITSIYVVEEQLEAFLRGIVLMIP